MREWTVRPNFRSAEAYGKAFKSPLLPPDGQQVRQGLGRVAVAPVPGVDHRDVGVFRRHQGRALLGMADGDDIRVAGDHLGSVRNALPLGRGGHGDHVAPQLVHGGLEAHAGAGGGLEEQGRQLFPAADLSVIVGPVDDIQGRGHKALQFLRGQVQNVNDASHAFAPFTAR